MKEIRSFLCDKRPDLFDYIASRDIAQKDNCVICLQWIVPYSGSLNLADCSPAVTNVVMQTLQNTWI